eukprot:CAMPEP_0185555958 /NCGR_PEP_ID=MMETSP1381-20130426/45866_1 /TAXON_ID=298111 /ORGANISM="Pavlova sp., Strain CCMP459" /LENGTH=111 /DNA_ID=CAMNT_0028169303 /DNA_START=41 /DNA_END=373 /DNA_ORIENTATION=-
MMQHPPTSLLVLVLPLTFVCTPHHDVHTRCSRCPSGMCMVCTAVVDRSAVWPMMHSSYHSDRDPRAAYGRSAESACPDDDATGPLRLPQRFQRDDAGQGARSIRGFPASCC